MSEFLTKVDETGRLLVSEVQMSSETSLVADFGIGCHLGAAVFAGPGFRLANKLAAHSQIPVRRLDEPAFEIPDMVSLTILDERPYACFQETDQPSAIGFGEQDELRIMMLENVDHLGLVIVFVSLVPEATAKPEPIVQISFLKRADRNLFRGH